MESEEREPVPKIVWLMGLAVLLLVAAITNEAAKGRRLAEVRNQVEGWRNRLSVETDENGRWKQRSSPLPETDAWGGALRVRYQTTKNSETLSVSSDGPDRKEWTSDDIVAEATNRDWVATGKDAADAVEDVAGSASRGLVGGAIEGVTDHIPKRFRDRWGIPSSKDEPEKPKEEEKK